MKQLRPDPGEMYTLRDLGVVEGRQCEAFDRTTAMGERLYPGAVCALLIRDPETQRTYLRSLGPLARRSTDRSRFVLSGSLTQRVCLEERVLTHAIPGDWSPSMPEIEAFGARRFCAAPVEDPAGDMVGIVAVMSPEADTTLDRAAEDVAALAACISERILLVATLATLKRVVSDRTRVGIVAPQHKH
jgi:hypothetical protein